MNKVHHTVEKKNKQVTVHVLVYLNTSRNTWSKLDENSSWSIKISLDFIRFKFLHIEKSTHLLLLFLSLTRLFFFAGTTFEEEAFTSDQCYTIGFGAYEDGKKLVGIFSLTKQVHGTTKWLIAGTDQSERGGSSNPAHNLVKVTYYCRKDYSAF